MTYKLHMSGVITGSLDCFCLACEVFLQSPHDATEHVRTSEHQKKAGAVQFSDKFPDEHIKKFKRGYYCEFCNVLMPIASKVNQHITEDEHKHNKGVLLLKSLGPDVVAFNNVLIEERAWHGLIEGVCSLCNAEFEDEDDHKADAEHSLNLVLKPIQFGADNAIFRHLDDTAVQCLTCNKLLGPGRMSKHFVDAEHLELFTKQRIDTNVAYRETEAKENRQENANNMTSVIENIDKMKNSDKDNNIDKNIKREDMNNDEKSPTEEKSKIFESIVKYQTKGMNINLEMEIAFCRKCSEIVTFDFNEIENHIDNHSSATKVDSDLIYPSHLDQHMNRVNIDDKTPTESESSNDQHTGEMSDTLKTLYVRNDGDAESDMCNSPTENDEKNNQEETRDFAKANKITYNGNYKQSYCQVCEVQLPSSFKSIKEHVEGTNHKRLVTSSTPSTTQPKTPGNLSKQATIEFIVTAIDIRTYFYIASMINTKYCILRNSLYLISDNDSRIRCFVCDMNLPPQLDVGDHARSRQHLAIWERVPVIKSERNEFIREVFPDLYHCGFCHLMVSGWTDMKRHLQSNDHIQHKTLWGQRLREHILAVHEHIRQEQRQTRSLMRIFKMFH